MNKNHVLFSQRRIPRVKTGRKKRMIMVEALWRLPDHDKIRFS